MTAKAVKEKHNKPDETEILAAEDERVHREVMWYSKSCGFIYVCLYSNVEAAVIHCKQRDRDAGRLT